MFPFLSPNVTPKHCFSPQVAYPRDPVVCQTGGARPLPGSLGGRGSLRLFLIWGCGPVSCLTGSLEGVLSALWAPERGAGAGVEGGLPQGDL